MTQASELIAKEVGSGINYQKTWGTIIYNVKDPQYGAKGNGLTDDTTSIQNAIAAAAVTGGVVCFPAGTFKTGNQTVPLNVTLWFTTGAKLSINTGTTVTINGSIQAELNQIFSGSGTVGGTINEERIYPQWFGAKGDSTADDTAAIQAAINATRPGGTCYLPGNRDYVLRSTLAISQTINFICDGYLIYATSTGAAIEVAPSPGPSPIINCEIKIARLTQAGGNTGQPASINTSGATGIRVNNLITSRIEVGLLMGFTYCGMFLDGRGGINANAQVIAHNFIDVLEIANCGYGILALSMDAATSNVEANDFRIGWMLQCFICLQLDDATHAGATSSNLFHITAIDNAEFHGVDIYGSFNYLVIAFMSTSIVLNDQSSYNTVMIGNNASTDVVVAYGGVRNRVITSMAGNDQLPASTGLTSGTVNQNPYGVTITVYLAAYASVGGTPGTVAAAIGDTNAVSTTVYTKQIGGSTTAGQPEVVTLRVPAGWYYKFTGSGATIGTATFVGE